MVTVNLIPETGQTLPLISRGGSSMLFTMIAFGMILSVSRQNDEQSHDRPKSETLYENRRKPMKQPLSLLVAAVAATACAPAVPAGEFRIVGKIENVPDGAVVRLYEPQGQMLRGIGVGYDGRRSVFLPGYGRFPESCSDQCDGWGLPGRYARCLGCPRQTYRGPW